MPERLLLGLLLLFPVLTIAQSHFQLTGYVRNGQTDAPVASASVLLLDVGLGTITDSAGYFSLPLPKGVQTVQVSHQGFETVQRTVTARADVSLSFRLTERVTLLRETIVTANQPGQNVRSNAVGVTTLSIRTLKNGFYLINDPLLPVGIERC